MNFNVVKLAAHTLSVGTLICLTLTQPAHADDAVLPVKERASQAEIASVLANAVQVAAGSSHSCALLTSGGVKCWGWNNSGQLGDGTKIDRPTPVDVDGLTSGVSAIAAGVRGSHTCALTVAGGMKCWGNNFSGQLGIGTTTTMSTPVDVVGLASGVSAISIGNNHTCAVTVSGSAKCWGMNQFGQVGDGTTSDKSTPVDVSGLSSGVSAIDAGGQHTCAVATGGSVKCWGYNSFGQLGNETKIDSLTPVSVSGLSSGVNAVTTGDQHTCALTTGGGALCWGFNAQGPLGIGTTQPVSKPVDVVGLATGVRAISAGEVHTCAVMANGGAKCWGWNYYGQVGNGTKTGISDGELIPVNVSGLTAGVSGIGAGSTHTCAQLTNGGVKCWGFNVKGQLGDDTIVERLSPVCVVGFVCGVFVYLPSVIR